MTESTKGNVLIGYKQKYLNLLHEILSLEPTSPEDVMRFQDFVRYDLDKESGK